ncbi:MAG: histidinol-phosphatase [Deltaproteobacteria bacterium]|nr:histidinol-phosphatase [Deltaproteobacteria bacterium]
MIDMHTHILPGVDDGPASVEESILMIQKGVAEGIKTFVLTPHYRDDADWSRVDSVAAAYDSLKHMCRERGIEADLILGGEVHICEGLAQKLKENPLATLGGRGSYVLVELPFTQLPVYTSDVLFRLLTARYIPVIAHPERCLYLEGNLKLINKWVEDGILLQMNTGSLNDRYGQAVKKLARKLLKDGLVHFWGSDVHSIRDEFNFDKAKGMPDNEIRNLTMLLCGTFGA